MTNEFKHKSVGDELTQTEWEAIGTHVFDSQATGDILYASSGTQLSRLAIGSTNNLLTVSGGVPAWTATATLTSLTLASLTSTSLTSVSLTLAGASSIIMGTVSTPIVNDTAGTNFVSLYLDHGASSGWGGGIYLTGLATGAGSSWTSIEGDVTVSAAIADTTGIESFMSFSSGGKVTGHAAACQATVDYANAALAFSGGAYMAGRFNIKGEGSSCDPSGAIRISCIEIQTQGTFATDKDFEKHAAGYAIYFNGFTAASGTGSIISSTKLAELPTGTIGVRVGVGADGAAGTAYYIPLVVATEWN
jgi:hypothetical protein